MVKSAELAGLRDIQLPKPIEWWSLASGWYVLIGLSVLVIGILMYFLNRHYKKGHSKREALRLLALYNEEYKRDGNSQLMSIKISELLRRVALVYFPREQVASLQGEAWLVFLNKTAKKIRFNEVSDSLLNLPYQPARKVELKPLFRCAKMWIKQRGQPCLP